MRHLDATLLGVNVFFFLYIKTNYTFVFDELLLYRCKHRQC